MTLERIPDRGVKAAHPIAIEEGVIARALSGVRVTERKTALQTAFSKQSFATRAFSEERYPFSGLPDRCASSGSPGSASRVSVAQVSARAFLFEQEWAGVGSSDPLLTNATLLETTRDICWPRTSGSI